MKDLISLAVTGVTVLSVLALIGLFLSISTLLASFALAGSLGTGLDLLLSYF